MGWGTLWRVFLGGALGTLLRIGVLFVSTQLVALFVVNLLGAAFLGWANGDRRFKSDRASAFWKVGFSGGFTTMSGVALFLARPDSALLEVALVVLMMLMGIWAYRLGKVGAQKWSR